MADSPLHRYLVVAVHHGEGDARVDLVEVVESAAVGGEGVAGVLEQLVSPQLNHNNPVKASGSNYLPLSSQFNIRRVSYCQGIIASSRG